MHLGSAGVGGRGGTQLIDFKNKALVYLYLRTSMGTSTLNLQAAWWVVPSTRGRIYVAFGEHPAAGGMYMFFESLCHFVRHCGVSLALSVAFCLHSGALGFHFDKHGI